MLTDLLMKIGVSCFYLRIVLVINIFVVITIGYVAANIKDRNIFAVVADLGLLTFLVGVAIWLLGKIAQMWGI